MDASGRGRPGTAIGGIVDYVSVSERRRRAVAVGVPFLFWLAVELKANLGLLPVGLAAMLCAYLYTRSSGRETLAASAVGAGSLNIGLYLFEVYRTVAGGSTEPIADTAVRLSGWLLIGVGLVALGVLFRRTDH